jgi:hypothetical protein
MAPVVALCGVVQNGTVLMLESALPIRPLIVSDGGIPSSQPTPEPPVRLWALKPQRLEETNAEMNFQPQAARSAFAKPVLRGSAAASDTCFLSPRATGRSRLGSRIWAWYSHS